MTGRKNRFDSWDGLDLDKAFVTTPSQCKDCINKVKVKGCKVFGERPYKYMSVSANVPCPERKVR